METVEANTGDALSILAVIGVLSEWLPNAAALAALIWTLIRIYEYVRFKLGRTKELYK